METSSSFAPFASARHWVLLRKDCNAGTGLFSSRCVAFSTDLRRRDRFWPSPAAEAQAGE